MMPLYVGSYIMAPVMTLFVGDISRSPPLNHFYFVDVRFKMGIPYGTSIQTISQTIT